MITILIYAIIIRAILSFIPNLLPYNNKLVALLYDVTDPLIKPFQRFQIGGGAMPVDFSPMISIIVLELIRSLIWRIF